MRRAPLKAEAESFDQLLPHFSREMLPDLLNELLEADNHHLNDSTALSLSNEEH